MPMNIELARFNMIEQQIRTWEVLDPTVLALLAVVRREDFVPPAYRAMAFMDTEVPLPSTTSPALQHMLPPRVEARLLQELDVHKHERVLEIGAGSGYMAALLGHRAQQVTTIEIDPDLSRLAQEQPRRVPASRMSRSCWPTVPGASWAKRRSTSSCCRGRLPMCRPRCWRS